MELRAVPLVYSQRSAANSENVGVGEDLEEVIMEVGLKRQSGPCKRPSIPDTMPSALSELMQGIWWFILFISCCRSSKDPPKNVFTGYFKF